MNDEHDNNDADDNDDDDAKHIVTITRLRNSI